MMGEKYWIVKLEVFAFETREDAAAYQEALIDAFCAMPESKEYGSTSIIRCEEIEGEPE